MPGPSFSRHKKLSEEFKKIHQFNGPKTTEREKQKEKRDENFKNVKMYYWAEQSNRKQSKGFSLFLSLSLTLFVKYFAYSGSCSYYSI